MNNDHELASLRERLAAAERENARLLGADPNKPPVADGLMRWKPILKGNILGMMGDADGGYVEFHEYRRLWNRATRAEADGAAMRQALVGIGNLYVPPADGEWSRRIVELTEGDHPGADLLAVVEAARKVTICHGAGVVGVEYEGFSATEIEDAYAHLGALSAALATYDARVQEGK